MVELLQIDQIHPACASMMLICHQAHIPTLHFFSMSFAQRQHSLLRRLHTETPVEIDPTEFVPALALHDAGFVSFIPNPPQGKTLAVMTAEGKAFLENLDE